MPFPDRLRRSTELQLLVHPVTDRRRILFVAAAALYLVHRIWTYLDVAPDHPGLRRGGAVHGDATPRGSQATREAGRTPAYGIAGFPAPG